MLLMTAAGRFLIVKHNLSITASRESNTSFWKPRFRISFQICSIGFIFSILLGLFYPFSGYNNWKLVKETKLISLSNSTVSGGTGLIYVSLSADNSYTYRFEVDSTFGNKSSKKYKTATIVNDNNIIEIEDFKCQEPILMEYKRTAKKSIWTFGLLSNETSYVFNVPEGTISKDITLR